MTDEEMRRIDIPRCDQCRRWMMTEEAAKYAPQFGECGLNTTMSSPYWERERLAVAHAGRFFTKSNFGCVEWEPKGV